MKVTKITKPSLDLSTRNKLRVAAYCRVSTDSDEQIQSLEAQIKHYETTINANPDWEFAGLYYDEGITGTKKDKRPELLRMITDCESRKIDLIVTKSISRFSRNTTDCLELVRKLLRLKIFILFEKENIHTGSMDSELMLSILSGLAENESASIAENVKWSIKRKVQNGTYKISCAPYGYDVMDGHLVVNEEQAHIVRFIFCELLSGKGVLKITRDLNAKNIPPRKGGTWSEATLRGMVKNEKYTGDALFQKTYTDEYFNRHANDGEKDQFLIQNHHEPIISHEIFNAAQAVIAQRGKEKGIVPKHPKYTNRYPFSGKIICGLCGGTFKRQTHTNSRYKYAWCCTTHITDKGKCSIQYITESAFEFAFVTMMNKLIFGHKEILRPLLEDIRGRNSDDTLLSIRTLDEKLEENADQRKVLVGLMTKGYLERPVYAKSNNELLQEAEHLQYRKTSLLRFLSSDQLHVSEVSELLLFASKADMLTSFDAVLFERFIDQIIVYSRTEIGFVLKCGITLRERSVT